MIGLDTNVVVRLFVEDDQAQTHAARAFVDRRCRPDNPGFVNVVTLCEVVWVLTKVHGFDRIAVWRLVEQMLQADRLVVQDEELVARALRTSSSKAVGLADALIDEVNRREGCQTTVTFDRRASKALGFELVTNHGD